MYHPEILISQERSTPTQPPSPTLYVVSCHYIKKPSSPLVVSDQDGTLPLPVVRFVQTLQMFPSFKLELDTG